MEYLLYFMLTAIAAVVFGILWQILVLNTELQNKENNRLKARIQSLETERDHEKQENATAKRELQILQEQLRIECRERRDVNHQFERAKSNYRELCEIKEIADAKCKINKTRDMEEKIRSLESELTHRIWDLERAQDETKDAEIEKQTLEMKLRRVTEKLKRLELENVQITSDRGFYTELFCLASKENAQLKRGGRHQRQMAAEAERGRHKAEKKLRRLRLIWTREKRKLEKRLAAVRRRLDVSYKQIKKLKRQIISLTTDFTHLAQHLRDMQLDKKNLQQEVVRLTKGCREAEERSENLEKMLENGLNHQEVLKEKISKLQLQKRAAENRVKELSTCVMKAERVEHHDCYEYLRKREMALRGEKSSLEKKVKQLEERMRRKEKETCTRCPLRNYQYRQCRQRFVKLRRKYAMQECNLSFLTLLLFAALSPLFAMEVIWAVSTEFYFYLLTRVENLYRKGFEGISRK
ncbi:probable DNA double-strand break repair Rad50 ATPase [Ptychodera flava]|uniref:probable DNA double-strand break repair Rad50 ATPase n=1 Tax=Ptychodera flava TaxID=63121 RepID=UPI00396A62C5